MFVILVGGTPEQRSQFVSFAEDGGQLPDVMWINDRKAFYYIADLFVHFGGQTAIPKSKTMITWSGDHQETLDRIYKTLGL